MANLLNFSSVCPRWQHRTDGLAAICNGVFWVGLDPNRPFAGSQGSHLAQCVIGRYDCTCEMTPKSVKQFKQRYDRVDRQTDRRDTEKCVGTGGTACARAIAPKSIGSFEACTKKGVMVWGQSPQCATRTELLLYAFLASKAVFPKNHLPSLRKTRF